MIEGERVGVSREEGKRGEVAVARGEALGGKTGKEGEGVVVMGVGRGESEARESCSNGKGSPCPYSIEGQYYQQGASLCTKTESSYSWRALSCFHSGNPGQKCHQVHLQPDANETHTGAVRYIKVVEGNIPAEETSAPEKKKQQ